MLRFLTLLTAALILCVPVSANPFMGIISGQSTYVDGGGGGDPDIDSWAQEGNTYTSTANFTYIAGQDSTHIAAFDPVANTLTRLTWDGSDFTVQGSALTGLTDPANQSGLVKLSSTRVAILDNANDEIKAYDWGGSSWSQVGNTFSLAMGNYPSGTYLADNSVMIHRSVGEDAAARYDFDGTNFSKVGNDFSTSTSDYHMPIGMTSTRVAMHSTAGTDKIEALDYSGSSWSQTGNDYSPSADSGKKHGVRMSDTRIVIWTGDNIQALDFDGADFATEGSAYNVGSSLSWPRSMAFMDSTHIAVHYYGGSGNIQVLEASPP